MNQFDLIVEQPAPKKSGKNWNIAKFLFISLTGGGFLLD
jgi:hypothetical protein